MASTSARLHHLDSLRAGLMILGVPYHATLAFAGTSWVITAPDRNPLLGVVSETIHVARMPVFFLLAGLFAAWVAERSGGRRWLAGRAKRLGIPLVFGVLVLGPLQIALLAAMTRTGPFADRLLTIGASPAYWIQHLWFLIDLLLFCAAYAALLRSRTVVRALDGLAHLLARAGGARWMALPFAVVAVLATTAYVTGSTLDVSELSAQVLSSNVLFYGVYFFVGVVFGRWRGGVEYLSNRPAPRLVVTTIVVVAAAVALALSRADAVGDAPRLLALARIVVTSLAGVMVARLLFGVVGAYLGRERVAVRWLVDSALVVYLVHQPIVIILDWTAIVLGLDPVLAFLLVTVCALVVSLAVYEVVSRIKTLRFLLTGTSRPGLTLASVVRAA